MLIRKVKLLGTTLGHALVLGCLVALPMVSAHAGTHTWDVNEIFSDSTGNVQFIELVEKAGTTGEVNVDLQSMSTTTIVKSFVIGGGTLTPPTSNKFFLLGTAAFAALPGAPALDAIIPSGVLPFFFSTAGDSVTFGIYDTLTYGAGVLPTDGKNSLKFDLTTGVNSPTNYAGVTGCVGSACPQIPVLSEWGLILFALLLLAVVARYGIGRPATS